MLVVDVSLWQPTVESARAYRSALLRDEARFPYCITGCGRLRMSGLMSCKVCIEQMPLSSDVADYSWIAERRRENGTGMLLWPWGSV